MLLRSHLGFVMCATSGAFPRPCARARSSVQVAPNALRSSCAAASLEHERTTSSPCAQRVFRPSSESGGRRAPLPCSRRAQRGEVRVEAIDAVDPEPSNSSFSCAPHLCWSCRRAPDEEPREKSDSASGGVCGGEDRVDRQRFPDRRPEVDEMTSKLGTTGRKDSWRPRDYAGNSTRTEPHCRLVTAIGIAEVASLVLCGFLPFDRARCVHGSEKIAPPPHFCLRGSPLANAVVGCQHRCDRGTIAWPAGTTGMRRAASYSGAVPGVARDARALAGLRWRSSMTRARRTGVNQRRRRRAGPAGDEEQQAPLMGGGAGGAGSQRGRGEATGALTTSTNTRSRRMALW